MDPLVSILARLHRYESQLAEGFRDLIKRHSEDYDLVRGCVMFAESSEAHVVKLDDLLEKFGEELKEDPHLAVYQGQATEATLFWDLEDLLVLAQETRGAWMDLEEVAEILESPSVMKCVGRGSADLDRAIGWLQSQIKFAAPRALTTV